VCPAKHNYIIGLPHRSAPGGDRNFLYVVAMYNDNNILGTRMRVYAFIIYLNHIIRMPKTLFVDDDGVYRSEMFG